MRDGDIAMMRRWRIQNATKFATLCLFWKALPADRQTWLNWKSEFDQWFADNIPAESEETTDGLE
jgi:hypothetical protein